MEEDIKILENFTQYNKFYKEEDGKLTITIDLDLKTELDKALENLIKAYKKQQAEIEDCKKCILRDDIHNYIEEIEKQDKIIELMAEQLTTPIHSKEWVIDYYKKEIEKC